MKHTGCSWVLLLWGATLGPSCQQKESRASCDLKPTRFRASASLTSFRHNIEEVDTSKMAFLEGGTFETVDHSSGKKKLIKLDAFFIDKGLVTVADFEAFVKATGYRTQAEVFGNSAVFVFENETWEMIESADFRHPFGPKGPKAQASHPVTQVSWNDAQAYARWQGKRLPTAAEWEWAASAAGRVKTVYAWGDRMQEQALYKANFWQGEFPSRNTQEDGFASTSPVGHFGSTALGLTDMGGNVWQWTSDDIAPTADEAQGDTSLRKLTKGGSFLCDPEVCHGFKIFGHSSSTPETGMVHTGFRCVKDLVPNK